jgi:hypothetical protein
MKMRKKLFCPILCLLILNFAFNVFAKGEKTYSCYSLSQEPVLDGRIENDPAWWNIPVAADFFKLSSPSLSKKQTEFKIGYLPFKALYIGIKCEEPEINKIAAQAKDAQNVIFGEDSIEIFVFPERAQDYFQFAVNAIGSRWNGKGRHKIPLGNWQAKTYRGENYWSVEIKIPFEVFKRIPCKDEVWTGNICRNILTHEDRYSTWAMMGEMGFHTSENFGKITFKDPLLTMGEKGKLYRKFLKNEIKERKKGIENILQEIKKDPICNNPSFQKKFLSFYKKKEIKIPKLDSLSLGELEEKLRKLIKFEFSLTDELGRLKNEFLYNYLFNDF